MTESKINSFTKEEVVKRAHFRCVHGHNGLVHMACYERKNAKREEKIGFADIEASNLTATFGIVYTYCIKELNGKVIKRSVTLKDLHDGIYDRNLVSQFIEDAKLFDRLIFHWGTDKKFDVPFLRTRAVKWGLPFPEHKAMWVSDTWPILKYKFKLHSNRLETACDFFDIESKEHKMNPEVWLKMITGNKKLMKEALDYIMIHNVEDVVSLEKLWKKISRYQRISKTSI